ncbi:hypothetical protein FIBSPDRAFT_963125 [Athelia psychrophila]|uniref:Uncharacterized protein n=1 Tax=Athelia psychrophila TaxID=1759441 RepID=A0A165ZB86_9AGAM|nr:hypothetical protein FIBSPDRAFT_963125 [Fibularhizoctonia sp. CBS 109695]
MTVRTPSDSSSDSGRGCFCTLGRVFLATAVLIPRSVSSAPIASQAERNPDLFVKSIQRIILMAGPHTEPVSIEGSPAGNTIGLVVIDQFLLKSGVLRDRATLVQIAIEARNAADLYGHRRGARLPIHRSELSCPSVYV